MLIILRLRAPNYQLLQKSLYELHTQKNVLSTVKGTEITKKKAACAKPKVGNGTSVNMTNFALGCFLPLNFHR